MNKKLLSLVVFLIGLILAAIYLNTPLQRPLSALTTSTKTSYHHLVEGMRQIIDEHFYQAKTIAEQREALAVAAIDQQKLHALANDYRALTRANESNITHQSDVELVRVISYARLYDTHKVWLEMEDFNASRTYGLLYQDMAAGIVIAEGDRPLALLNGDPKSSYAVAIGANHAPGIAHGTKESMILVKFIPSWIVIAPGDEVVTSGLDNLFFAGVRVGKVVSVTATEGYQNAMVAPYFQDHHPSYFHVILSTH
jgi:rod shape-determining protein MreC